MSTRPTETRAAGNARADPCYGQADAAERLFWKHVSHVQRIIGRNYRRWRLTMHDKEDIEQLAMIVLWKRCLAVAAGTAIGIKSQVAALCALDQS